MKKIVNISLLFILVFTFGCKNTLDAPAKSALEESVVFSSPDLTEAVIAGIFHSFGETESYRGRYIVYYGINTDTEVYNSLRSSTTNDKGKLSNYDTNANNTEMNRAGNAWAKFYEAVERCNIAIRGLRTYGNIESNPLMAQFLGEVLTLRAVIYNDLIKGWGDVPARFEPATSETTYLPRSDRDVIFKQLLADLEEATGYLPWPNSNSRTSSVERVNKAFAKGLRARLALYAGGYAQRSDGVIRRSNDPDLTPEKMYEITKNECLDIIESKTVKLLPSFEQVFRLLNQESLAAGNESMWEIPFSEGRGRVIFDLGVKHIDPNKYTAQAKGGTNGPNPVMLYEYEDGDERRDVTIVPYEWKVSNGQVYQDPTNLNKLYFGKYRYEWMNRRVTNANDDGLNWMYMRYADVLLMAAEAINALEGPENAAQYLKLVRERAFPNNPEKVTTFMNQATSSPQSFFEAIVNERALEFCGEMLRKADLIRWNLLGEKMEENKEKLRQLNAREGKYATVPTRIYYRTAADNETVEIYGIRPGETTAPTAGTYTSDKAWSLTSSSDNPKYWEAVFVRNPNVQQYWPIWELFIINSNGMLNNGGVNYQ